MSLLPALEGRLPEKDLYKDASHRPNANGSRLDVTEDEHRTIVN